MSEQQAAAEQQFRIQKIYVKDISLESPDAPQIFTAGSAWKPEVNLQLNSTTNQLEEDRFEIALTLTVTVKVGEKTAYLIEITQAGLFQIAGVPGEQMGGLLGAYCPGILFPYAREAVSDLAVRAGFPQLLLEPINFDALYNQHRQQQAESAADAPETLQ